MERYSFGVLGDSSLYCKGPNKKPRKLGHRLRELLYTEVWYEAIASAGVAQLLQKFRSGPEIDTLGVSYFGNDIMLGPITEQVEADWKEFIRAVKLKSRRAVFVIGGFAAKYRGMQLSTDYDRNLQYVRSLVQSEGLFVTDLRQKVKKWKLCSDGIHWHEDEKEDVCATWARLLRGEDPPFPDFDFEAEDSLEESESPITSPSGDPPGRAAAACWGSRRWDAPKPEPPRQLQRLPQRPLPVPATGFQDAEWEDLSQESRASQAEIFSVTVFRRTPQEKLGIRMEPVSGAGYDSAARVHRIFEGGLIDRWNRMQQSNGLHGWAVQVGDVIVGLNGQHEFEASSFLCRPTPPHLQGLPEGVYIAWLLLVSFLPNGRACLPVLRETIRQQPDAASGGRPAPWPSGLDEELNAKVSGLPDGWVPAALAAGVIRQLTGLNMELPSRTLMV
ncbi:unnamed protein product [Symbiodinium sp. CCMP2592]|nr:unnamed protein product [Symbiodinium sp. CCMP2592]